MKKILITILIALIFSMSIYSVKADISEIQYQDINTDDTYWSYLEAGGIYYFKFNVDIIVDYPNYNYFMLSLIQNANIMPHITQIYYAFLGTSMTVHNLHIDLSPDYRGQVLFYQDIPNLKITSWSPYEFQAPANLRYNTMGFYLNHFYTLNSSTSNAFEITFVTDYTSLPDSATQTALQQQLVFRASNDINICYFYSGGGAWDYDLYATGSLPTETSFIPTRSGYLFQGWRTITGDYYDFQSPVLSSYLNSNGEFVLYASFINVGSGGDVSTEITNNIPEGLKNIMGIIYADNNEGYMMLLFLINIFIIMIALLLKLNSFAPIIASLVLYALWIYFGVMNIYIIILLGLIYAIIILSFVFKPRNLGGE